MCEFVEGVGAGGVVFGGFGEGFFPGFALVFEVFADGHLDGDAKVVSVLCDWWLRLLE